MSSIAISAPANNANVAANFTVTGTCSSDVTSVTVTLTSSLGTVLAINNLSMPNNGNWSTNFNVNANNYPNNSTVTATVTGTTTSVQITISIT